MSLPATPSEAQAEGGSGEPAAALLLADACSWLRAQTPRLVDETLRAVSRELPEYRALPEPARGPLRNAVTTVYALVTAALETGNLPRPERLDAIGAQRASQRISVPSLLRAFEIGHDMGWTALADRLSQNPPSAAKDAAYKLAGGRLIAAMHELNRRVEAAHRAARERLETPAERRRLDIIRDLLSGRFEDDHELLTRAQASGIDLKTPHALVIASCRQPDDHLQQLRACLTTLQGATKGSLAVSFLHATPPHAVVLIPAPTEAIWQLTRRRLLHALSDHAPVSALLALPPALHSPTAYHATYARLHPLVGFTATMHPGLIVDAAATDVITALTDDHQRLVAFVRRVCDRLLQEDRGRRVEIADTVLRWYEHGQSFQTTARALRLNVKTVRARVEQLATLTGRDPARDHVALGLALALLPLAVDPRGSGG